MFVLFYGHAGFSVGGSVLDHNSSEGHSQYEASSGLLESVVCPAVL